VVKSLQTIELSDGGMPVILDPTDYDFWLDLKVDDVTQLRELLHPYPGDDPKAEPVSTLVNSPRNNVVQCIEPIE